MATRNVAVITVGKKKRRKERVQKTEKGKRR